MGTFLAALPKIERAMRGQPATAPFPSTPQGSVPVSQAGTSGGILGWMIEQVFGPARPVSVPGVLNFTPGTGGSVAPPISAPTGLPRATAGAAPSQGPPSFSTADVQVLLLIGAACYFIREARRASKPQREAGP
jgi:hypothetical protein